MIMVNDELEAVRLLHVERVEKASRSLSFAYYNSELVIADLIELGASKAKACEIFNILLCCTDDVRPSASKDLNMGALTRNLIQLPRYHATDHFRAMISTIS